MKVETNQTGTKVQKLNKIINFPKKLNLFALGLIVIAYAVLAVVGIAYAAQKDYVVKPNYEEMGPSEKINFFFKLYSNYTENSNGTIKKSDVINLCYYGINNNKSVRTSTWVSMLYDDDSMVYYDTKETTYESGTKTGVLYIASGTSQERSPLELYCAADFDLYGETTTYNVEFSKKTIQLSNKEIKKAEINEFTSASYEITKDEEVKVIKIFKDLKVTASAPGADATEKVNSVVVKFTLNTEATNKYVLDLQAFAVDDDKNVYKLSGFYNLSNNTLQTYSITSKLSTKIDVEYVIVKANYIDQNGEIHELFYKTSFKNILN